MQDITLRKPRLIGEDEGLLLKIYAEFESSSSYYARISEDITGSESDVSGRTLGELVNSALEWAGVEDFRVAFHGSAESIRNELHAAGELMDSDDEFEVRLFTDF